MSCIRFVGIILSVLAIILIAFFLFKKNEPFFNLREILSQHILLFQNCKSQYFVFYFFPLLLSIGLSLLVTVNTAFFSHLGVVLSIILSMLLALMSILTNYDYSIIENQKQKEKLKVVVKQTTNAIIFSCIIGILMLLIGFVVIAVSDKNISWIPIDLNLCKILLSVFTYYGLCVILLTLLLIIKNLTKIIAFNLAIERKEK